MNQLETVLLPKNADYPERTYIHRRYDANGNLKLTTLPVKETNPDLAAQNMKTVLEYWDPGWIQKSDDHVLRPTRYDYRAEGWQSLRTFGTGLELSPEFDGTTWSYFPDGRLARTVDRDGQGDADYTYDLHDNLATAAERRRVRTPGQTPYTILATHNAFDELTKTRQKQAPDLNYRVTEYSYDANGNVATREDDGVEPSTAGRKHVFAYDESDQLTADHDWGADKLQNSPDDHRTTIKYLLTGWRKQKLVERKEGAPSGGDWPDKVRTDWTYFKNGDTETQNTTNSQGTVVEEHVLGYFDGTIYVNGHRTSDKFKVKGPTAGPPCGDIAYCMTRYSYGPRENLIREIAERPMDEANPRTTTYTPNDQLNITNELVTKGAVTVRDTDFIYDGNRLIEARPDGGTALRYLYEREGKLDCVTTTGWTNASCPAAPGQAAGISTALVEDYTWNELLDTLQTFRRYNSGTLQDRTTYEHDPLNRLVKEVETHPGGGGAPRTTCFSHIGLSGASSSERRVPSTCDQTATVARSYGYDADLERTNVNVQGGLDQGDFYFARNVHGDVSLLLREGGGRKAAYAYEPYGRLDPDLSDEENADESDPFNLYRFNDKRLDPGSGSTDMGARRFSTNVGRFLQSDAYEGAQDDLGLSLGPLTQNRYAFAGGNPVGFLEDDGHMAMGTGERGLRRARRYLRQEHSQSPDSRRYVSFGTRSTSSSGGSAGRTIAPTKVAPEYRRCVGPGSTIGSMLTCAHLVGLEIRAKEVIESNPVTSGVNQLGQTCASSKLSFALCVGGGVAEIAAAGAPIAVGTRAGAGAGRVGILGRLFRPTATTRQTTPATGQTHHVISARIARALERHPNLAGQYSARDPRFTTRAIDETAHRGYQGWHRELDAEIEQWIVSNPSATRGRFEAYLRRRYSQQDLRSRFPNGF